MGLTLEETRAAEFGLMALHRRYARSRGARRPRSLLRARSSPRRSLVRSPPRSEMPPGFGGLVRDGLPESIACSTIEIWVKDEARAGQRGGNAYIWYKLAHTHP